MGQGRAKDFQIGVALTVFDFLVWCKGLGVASYTHK